MTVEQIIQLVQALGPAGAVLLALGYALRSVHAQLSLVQEKRISDAQLSTAKLLELTERQHYHSEQLARAMESVADAVRDQRGLVETLLADRGVMIPRTVPRVPALPPAPPPPRGR